MASLATTPSIVFSLIPVIVGFLILLRRHLIGGLCHCNARDLHGKSVVITGGEKGIGMEAATEFARRGASVFLCTFDVQAALAAVNKIKTLLGKNARLFVRQLDLSDLNSVRRFAKMFLETEAGLDVLINNAGVCHPVRHYSSQGHEMNFAVNHLGHFLLTMLLLPALQRSSLGRVITVASFWHNVFRLDLDDLNCEKRFLLSEAYSKSKLCNILFSKELARRMADRACGVTAVSLQPGVVRTGIGDHILKQYPVLRAIGLLVKPLTMFFMKTPWEGAQATIHCVLAERLESGKHYDGCKIVKCGHQADDENLARRLWTISAKLCELSRDATLE